MPKNYNNNDHEVQVELDTHIKEETIENSKSSILKYQQHDSIALSRLKCIIRPPIRYGSEDLIFMHLLLVTGILLLFKRHYTTKIKINGWVL